MLRIAPPLLTRLRRHHGAWMLCVFVLLLKLVTAAVCLADAPRVSSAATTAHGDVASVPASVADGGDACLLGEAGDCHCACAHAVPLTGVDTSDMAALDVGFAAELAAPTYRPTPPGSLLRPPIA